MLGFRPAILGQDLS